METKTHTGTAAPSISKGPIEGIVLVNGRPQMERADMPTISFESVEAIMRMCNKDAEEDMK